MSQFPDKMVKGTRKIREEVTGFDTSQYSYYGVTRRGFVFNILKVISIQPAITTPEDYFCYMWVHSVEGFLLLRQRFLNNMPGRWYAEVEIIPEHKDNPTFMDLGDYFRENPEMLQELCGPPHEDDVFSGSCFCNRTNLDME